MNCTKWFLGATAALCVAAAGLSAEGQVPVSGVNGSVSLSDIVGTSTLVTVVIKGTEAIDPNCHVAEIGPNYVAVIGADGRRNAYLFSDIKELRVQGGKVEQQAFRLTEDRILTDEEQEVYNRAVTRAGEIFDRAIANQSIRMRAASIIGSENDERGPVYLQRLSESNDMLTAVRAMLQLYAMDAASPSEDFIRQGLNSGDRRVRAQAIVLVGAMRLERYEERLLDLSQERIADVAAPAAYALGRLKSTRAVPALLDMIIGLNEFRAESAKTALIEIGGDQVVGGLKHLLPNASGTARYRLMEALHYLNDPLGERLLKDEALSSPSLGVRAAMALARTGDFDARERLEERLNARFEDTPEQLIQRGEIASVLVEIGDRRHVSTLQALLQSQHTQVQEYALSTIARLGLRNLMELTVPAMTSSDDTIAVLACEAAAACARPEYRERLNSLRIVR